MATEKKCSACGVVKPASEFYRRSDRDAPRSQCKSCMEKKREGEAERHAARAAAWRAADQERSRTSSRASWGRNRDKRQAYNRKRLSNPVYQEENRIRCRNRCVVKATEHRLEAKRQRESDPARWKAYIKQYAKDNPEKWRSYNNNRRALKAQAKGFWTDADILELRAFQGDRCAVCLIPLHGKGHVDHIRALTRGGSNWPRNLQVLCKTCNSKKRNKDFTEFLTEMELL